MNTIQQLAAKHAATIAAAICTADSPQARCVRDILIAELPKHLESFADDLSRPDAIRLDWIEQKANDCEGHILSRLFLPDGKPFRDKVDAAISRDHP